MQHFHRDCAARTVGEFQLVAQLYEIFRIVLQNKRVLQRRFIAVPADITRLIAYKIKAVVRFVLPLPGFKILRGSGLFKL